MFPQPQILDSSVSKRGMWSLSVSCLGDRTLRIGTASAWVHLKIPTLEDQLYLLWGSADPMLAFCSQHFSLMVGKP